MNLENVAGMSPTTIVLFSDELICELKKLEPGLFACWLKTLLDCVCGIAVDATRDGMKPVAITVESLDAHGAMASVKVSIKQEDAEFYRRIVLVNDGGAYDMDASCQCRVRE